MASISTAGIGSGIDIPGLVGNLIEAERTPAETRFDKQEVDLQAKLSAFGSLKSAMSSFQDSLSGLKNFRAFNDVTTESSDETIITAKGSSIADPGKYSLEVTNLAQPHSISSKSFDEASDTVGRGTLTFEFGNFDADKNSFVSNSDKTPQSITIDEENHSLQGIRDTVNEAKMGVTASLINDGSGYKLLFTSDETGKASGMKISVSDLSDTDNTDASGLSQLAFNPDPAAAENSQMEENLAPLDAALSFNGLSITSASNDVNTLIPGVTLNLKGVTQEGSPATITIGKNDEKIMESVTGFTEKFNELVDTLKQLSSYDIDSKQAGPLLGDSVIRNVESQLRKMLSSSFKSTDGSTFSLASAGITTDRTGKLSLNTEKLQTMLTEDRETLTRIFSAQGATSDSQINLITSSKDTQSGDYSVNLESVSSRGQLSGTAAASLADLETTALTIDDSNDSLSLLIDGIETGEINLTQQDYSSGAELAAEIQDKINANSLLQANGSSVLVSFSEGKLQISSALYGAQSSVEITAIEGADDLGLAIGTGIQGTDLKGSIGGKEADSKDNTLTGNGDASGIILEITGGATGNRGSVIFNRGIADQLDGLLSQFLESDSLIDNRTEGINNRIEKLNEKRTALDDKLTALEARLYKQFNTMDTIVAQLQSTGSYLEQQLDNLPGVVKKN